MAAVAIVQARMGSSRLPGKIMLPLAEHPALWHVIDRLGHASSLSRIVVATTQSPEDDVIDDFCQCHKLDCFRGSEQDVLDRYYQAARQYQADPIIRITADCPVIDPVIVDEVVTGYFAGHYDFYALAGKFPDGLDCVAFSFSALEQAWRDAVLSSEREHVCPYIEKHPARFKLGGYEKFQSLEHMRWTLDEPADYQLLSKIFAELYNPEKPFLSQDILDLFEREPTLCDINRGILRNAGYQKSLREDAQYQNQNKE